MVEVPLVAAPTLDPEQPQALQVLRPFRDQFDRVPPLPAGEDVVAAFSSDLVERQVEPMRGVLVRPVEVAHRHDVERVEQVSRELRMVMQRGEEPVQPPRRAQTVGRLGEVAGVAVLEVGVAAVARRRCERVRMFERHHQRAVPAARFPEDATMFATRTEPELPLGPRHELLDDVRCPRAHRRRVDVLVAAEARHRVHHDDDHRRHALRADQPIEALREVLLVPVVVEERRGRAREARQRVEHGVVVVPRLVALGQVDGHTPHVRVPEAVARQQGTIEVADLDASTHRLPPAVAGIRLGLYT